MIIFKESRHLETLKCFYNEPMDVFVFQCAGKKTTIQYATPEQIASIFRKAGVKDEHTEPRSVRGKTYLEMVAAVINGSDTLNYLWSNCVDLFFEICEELRQSRIGKQVPLTESKKIIPNIEFIISGPSWFQTLIKQAVASGLFDEFKMIWKWKPPGTRETKFMRTTSGLYTASMEANNNYGSKVSANNAKKPNSVKATFKLNPDPQNT